MIKYDTGRFEKDLDVLGISLSEEQIRQYIRYYELLIEWNKKVNLTAITEYEDVMKKHFIDSLALVKVFAMTEEAAVIDVGSGAGFPGLALKIAFPFLQVTLLDSLNKRIRFLDTVIEELALEGAVTVHGRAEDLSRQDGFRDSYDLCVSRAVANLSTLSEYCLPFVKRGGKFIAYKSGQTEEEARAAEKAIVLLGGRAEERIEFVLPNSEISRSLYVIGKTGKTPERFPRKAGLPGSNPL